MAHAIPHPSGLFSGRMAARLAPEAWAEVVRAPRRAAPAHVVAILLIVAQIGVLGATVWIVRGTTNAVTVAGALPAPWEPEALPLPAFPPIETDAPAAPAAPVEPPSRPLPSPGMLPGPLPTPTPAPALHVQAAATLEATARVRVMTTGYCPCDVCCAGSSDGVTAINRDVDVHPRGIAADPRLVPYRTWLEVPGYGRAMVDDTGGAMRQDGERGIVHLDLRFRTHSEARRWGVQWHEIEIPRAAPAAALASTDVR